ncbi:ROK family protein [cyanobiont of Ornithocercus magnificus]|nr:ROK family protein [cyanobiont of Ornithocercus magnificus]
MLHVIGVDISITSMKLGLFDKDGSLLSGKVIPTPKLTTPGTLTIALCEAVTGLDPDHRASLIGISLPGLTDVTARVVCACTNFPGWENVPLAEWLEARLGRQVTLENNTSCTLAGEAWKGSAVGFINVVLLTFGSRVCGSAMLKRKSLIGYNGNFAEPSLIGSQSHYDNSIREQPMGTRIIRYHCSSDLAKLAQEADAGNQRALTAWTSYITTLGLGISSLVYTFTPQLVLLSGLLVGNTYHFLLPRIYQELTQCVQQLVSYEGLLIRSCTLGNDASRLGAAHLALKRLAGM